MGSASSSIEDSTAGYHILKVQDGSPGQKAGLEAFFDFIVAVGDIKLEGDNGAIKDVLTKYKDKPMRLEVYSSKTQQFRQVTLVPTENWGGQGLLGLSIRYCSFKGACENVWHVLDVSPGSPAAMAGLQPFQDYIVGTDALLSDSEDFFSVVETHNGQPLRLYVYNSGSDRCREVTLIPNLSWGGNGMLGCEIGFGYLHRIPAPPSSTKDTNIHPSAVTPTPVAVTNAVHSANQIPQQQTLMPQQPLLYSQAHTPPPLSTLPPSSLPSQTRPVEATNGLPPAQPPPMYPAVPSIDGVPLAPPAPLPSNLFEGIHITPPSTPSAFVVPSADHLEASVVEPSLPPPAPPSATSLPLPETQPQAPPLSQPPLIPAFAPPSQPQMPPPMQAFGQPPPAAPFSVPLIPTTNVAPPGMPPISVQMPPADLLTGYPAL